MAPYYPPAGTRDTSDWFLRSGVPEIDHETNDPAFGLGGYCGRRMTTIEFPDANLAEPVSAHLISALRSVHGDTAVRVVDLDADGRFGMPRDAPPIMVVKAWPAPNFNPAIDIWPRVARWVERVGCSTIVMTYGPRPKSLAFYPHMRLQVGKEGDHLLVKIVKNMLAAKSGFMFTVPGPSAV